jgi:hemoglobin/transferrin/lactoferrin receptor protein
MPCSTPRSWRQRRSAVAATGCWLLTLCGAAFADERSVTPTASAAAANNPESDMPVLPEVRVQATPQRPPPASEGIEGAGRNLRVSLSARC